MSNNGSNHPKARTEKLIIKDLPDETLVYDLETDKAYCLNSTAAKVWQNCDGSRTTSDLREVIQSESDLAVPEEVIWVALDQLEKSDLLEPAAVGAFRLPGISRRDIMRRVALASVAVPLIVSISTAPAHAQASLLAPGRCCGNPSQCASNSCTQNPTCTAPPPAQPSTKACA